MEKKTFLLKKEFNNEKKWRYYYEKYLHKMKSSYSTSGYLKSILLRGLEDSIGYENIISDHFYMIGNLVDSQICFQGDHRKINELISQSVL